MNELWLWRISGVAGRTLWSFIGLSLWSEVAPSTSISHSASRIGLFKITASMVFFHVKSLIRSLATRRCKVRPFLVWTRQILFFCLWSLWEFFARNEAQELILILRQGITEFATSHRIREMVSGHGYALFFQDQEFQVAVRERQRAQRALANAVGTQADVFRIRDFLWLSSKEAFFFGSRCWKFDIHCFQCQKDWFHHIMHDRTLCSSNWKAELWSKKRPNLRVRLQTEENRLLFMSTSCDESKLLAKLEGSQGASCNLETEKGYSYIFWQGIGDKYVADQSKKAPLGWLPEWFIKRLGGLSTDITSRWFRMHSTGSSTSNTYSSFRFWPTQERALRKKKNRKHCT